VALLLEIGLLLVIIPWSSFWERNYFAALMPGVRELITNNYLRGAISGLGIVNLWVALGDLADLIGRRRSGPEPEPHDGG
jgi:hypothetical protein